MQPSQVDYTATVEHDGRSYEVEVLALEVPKCQKCGKLVLVDSANRRISEALRKTAKLLFPAEIRQNRERLHLTQKQLANLMEVAVETVSRWETGAQIQQRSFNKLLKAIFRSPEVRKQLAEIDAIEPVAMEAAATNSSPTD